MRREDGMSLVALKAANHSQHVSQRGPDRSKDERYTPRALIEAIHAEWRFTVDACGCGAAPASQVIGRYWDIRADGLAQDWDGETVWANVPFSHIRPWVEKAWRSRARACLMMPANRTEQGFWQELIEPYRDNLDGVLRTMNLPGKYRDVLVSGRGGSRRLPGRIPFGTPESPEGADWKSSTPFGCVLVMWQSPWRPDWAPLKGAV
jgi:hypothetical protein